MRIRKKIALSTAGLFLLILCIAGAQGAPTYNFGSKVHDGDQDISRALDPMPCGTIFAFWDTGVPGYDENDVAYLHIPKDRRDPNPQVTDNDVRLTPYAAGGYAAGSKVAIGDDDLGKPLKPFPGAIVRYLDQYGSPNYDLTDPVYLHQNINSNSPSSFETVNYDVRLTDVVGTALTAGTKITDLDPDRNKLLGLIPASLGPIAYFDKNGDALYDDGDEIYLNYPSGGFLVRINNVRLTDVYA